MSNHQQLASALHTYQQAYKQERERIRDVVKAIVTAFTNVLEITPGFEWIRTSDVVGPVSEGYDPDKRQLEPATGESVYRAQLWLEVQHARSIAGELRYDMEIKVLRGAEYEVTILPGAKPIKAFQGHQESFRAVAEAMFTAASRRLMALPGTRLDGPAPVAYYKGAT